MGFSSDTDFKIVFDDGYESVFYIALPLMEKYGFTGTVFPVGNYIGKMNDWDVNFGGINKARHLSKYQIVELSNNGWEIGSHGLTHTAFTSLSRNKLDAELQQSKLILEDIINKEIISITPPFSLLNDQIKDSIIT